MNQDLSTNRDELYRGVYIEHNTPERNLHRTYGLPIARPLFGQWSLLRFWGRTGTKADRRPNGSTPLLKRNEH